MALIHAGLLLLLFGSAYSYEVRGGAGYGHFVQNPELEWERMETVIGDEKERALAPETKFWRSTTGSDSSTPQAKEVPQYMTVSASQDQKEVFKPEKGFRPLPYSIMNMLLRSFTGTITTTPVATTSPKMVEILCHVDRMYVRIKREFFKTRNAWKYLKLGTCAVKASTKEHYYLLNLLQDDCGFQKESNVDMRVVRIVLHYKPPGPVLREESFDVSLQCNFPRLLHSFKVGFYPKLQGGTVLKALTPKSSFTITPQDASGNEIVGAKTYTLGQPMYFEVKQAKSTAGFGAQRVYINKCFMTAYQDPNSNPKYTVIDNQGCMIDGVVTGQSKFLTDASKMTQKFSVVALIFKDTISTSSSQQLYMHCDISVGTLTPTWSSKACNYDPTTKKWKELYGDDSVCTCCDSTCPSAKPKASRDVTSSHSWKVDLSWKDRYAAVDPWMKSHDADAFSLEDPDMAEHEDFLKYWEHDY